MRYKEVIHFIAWVGMEHGEKLGEMLSALFLEYVGGEKEFIKIEEELYGDCREEVKGE